jgi:hypothetical protein
MRGDRTFAVAAAARAWQNPGFLRLAASRALHGDQLRHLAPRAGRIMKAAMWSLQGLRAAWLHESSFRLEVYLFAVLGPLGCGWARRRWSARCWSAADCW